MKKPKTGTWSENGDAANFNLTTTRPIRTLAQVIRASQANTQVWAVESWECKPWTTTLKGPDKRPIIVQNFALHVKFKRKIAKRMSVAGDLLLRRIRAHSPIVGRPRAARGEEHLLEISPFDVHFGKLAWAPETGMHYDLRIADRVFRDAFDDLLSDTAHVGIEKIILPIGQDFLHFDQLIGTSTPTTANGTAQDVDGRWAKVFSSAVAAMMWGVERCLRRAPVQILWVPGNHDWMNSYHLCRELTAYFGRTPHFTADVSPQSRKYVRYGVNLLGFAHGDQEKHGDLPLIMAGEQRRAWASAKCCEWHLGHFHKAKATRYNEGDTFGSVKVRILPSLSGTDAWHYRRGYVNTPRACEAYLWSKTRGFRSSYSASPQCLLDAA